MDKNSIPCPCLFSLLGKVIGVLKKRSSSRSEWVLTCLWCHLHLGALAIFKSFISFCMGLLWFVAETYMLYIFPFREFYGCQPWNLYPSAVPWNVCHRTCLHYFLQIFSFPFHVMIFNLWAIITSLFPHFHLPEPEGLTYPWLRCAHLGDDLWVHLAHSKPL